jgi:hypothetical protein
MPKSTTQRLTRDQKKKRERQEPVNKNRVLVKGFPDGQDEDDERDPGSGPQKLLEEKVE